MSRLGSKKSRRLSSKLPSSEDIAKTREKNGDEGVEILHFSHPEHPLVRCDFPYLFMCMGCREYGAGRRYMCQTCGFQLHDFCALAPPSLYAHPFHRDGHHLVFLIKPGGFLRCKCDVCGKSAKGYSFRCTSCSFDMHPCCATMDREMEFSIHQHPLVLAPALEAGAGGESSSFVCQMCRRKRSGHVYQCASCGYYLHARCAKDLVNGLYVHGIVPPEKSSNGIAAAAKVTMNALFGVIGGLIEGIGEGIGEALVDNIAKARSRAIRQRQT